MDVVSSGSGSALRRWSKLVSMPAVSTTRVTVCEVKHNRYRY